MIFTVYCFLVVKFDSTCDDYDHIRIDTDDVSTSNGVQPLYQTPVLSDSVP